MPSMATKSLKKSLQTPSFEQEAVRVIGRLRVALADVVTNLPGDIRRAADVQQCLGIDKTLAWQVFKFAAANNAIVAGAGLPGSAALATFLKTAGRKGVSPDSVRGARSALEDFDRLVTEHAGDRKTFDVLLGGLAGEDGEQIDLPSRRQAFHCTSRFMGVQARARFGCMALHPGTSGELGDIVVVSGYIDLRWLRATHAPFVINTFRTTDTDDVQRRAPVHQPLDLEAAKPSGVSFLSQFCSQPLPRIREHTNAHKFLVTELVGDGVGKRSSVTYVTGELIRGVGERFRDEHNQYLRHYRMVRVPSETHITDVLIHDGMIGKAKGEAFVLGDFRCTDGSVDGRERDLLPIKCEVEHLGRGVDVMSTRDVPRYAEMMRYAFDHVGWNAEKFDVYRCRLEYPVLPSTVVVQFDLPEKPEPGDAE
jgi:hypothetical protein